jgi:OOP family OmpA-OmpF porin
MTDYTSITILMKSPYLYLFLFLVWMSFSTWYYVCKIKNHCENGFFTELLEKNNTENNETNNTYEDIVLLETTDTGKLTEEEKLDKLKSKIENGYTVYNFPENSAVNQDIEQSFKEFAEDLQVYLKKNPNDRIEIIGHTDDTGSKKGNIKFGKKRALFIQKKLLEAGIAEDQMLIISKGKDEPVASNKTEEGRKKNRRVVIQLKEN